ncbi:MAG TPA: methyltransferase domain-containing protein [Kineosporiaceae bacterium]|nr:methyltransferase domain-containing protein [Kineosporiaceae bacterium]
MPRTLPPDRPRLDEAVRPYEDAALRRVTGDALRPGGPELTDHALSLAGLYHGARVLDLGCGAGTTVQRLTTRHGLAAAGLDLSAQLTAAGRARSPGLPLLRGRAERLPLADASVDAVLAECVLSLLPDPAVALAEVARVLRTRGRIVIADLYARNHSAADDLRRLPDGSCLRGAFTVQRLLRMIRRGGFALLCWEDHSAALTELAVRLVLNDGGADRLWCPVPVPVAGGRAAAPVSPEPDRAAIRAARPGYFVLIAEKTGG